MPSKFSRRRFMKQSLAIPAGAALGFQFEEKVLLAHAAQDTKPADTPEADSEPLPRGKIGNVEISRLICGGNLISGFAHSRDLIYVSPLLKHYFTDEKVMDTLELCEEHGINTAILRVDEHTLRIITRYWDERGGKIQ